MMVWVMLTNLTCNTDRQSKTDLLGSSSKPKWIKNAAGILKPTFIEGCACTLSFEMSVFSPMQGSISFMC